MEDVGASTAVERAVELIEDHVVAGAAAEGVARVKVDDEVVAAEAAGQSGPAVARQLKMAAPSVPATKFVLPGLESPPITPARAASLMQRAHALSPSAAMAGAAAPRMSARARARVVEIAVSCVKFNASSLYLADRIRTLYILMGSTAPH